MTMTISPARFPPCQPTQKPSPSPLRPLLPLKIKPFPSTSFRSSVVGRGVVVRTSLSPRSPRIALNRERARATETIDRVALDAMEQDELGLCFFGDFDPDYEFDSAHFFDFTRPESRADVEEAESWFRTASGCPPSPFVLEMMRDGADAHPHASNVFDEMPSSSSASIVSNTTGCLSAQDGRQIGLASPKSTAKKTMTLSKGSTLMKPTASHLAKLNHRKEVSKTVSPQKQCMKGIEKSLRNSVIQDQATKRQKLESGYLRKAAQLNHQISFSHKKPIEVAHLDRRPIDVKKVTIPREPKLETARRALIRSYKCRDAAEQDCDTKSSTHSFKALPLNKKILQSPSLHFRKKAAPLIPEFQEFQRAMEHSSENVRVGIPFHDSAVIAISMPVSISISQTTSMASERSSFGNSISHEATCSIRYEPIADKESNSKTGKKTSAIPPVELFSKLSLISERQRQTSHSKHVQTTRV